MQFGKIQSSDFLDIFRIENGSLLYVNKYVKDPNYRTHFYNDDFKKSSKIVRGCKGLRQVKSDYDYYDYSSGSTKTLKAGAFVLSDIVVLLTQPKNFTFEIKSNEGFGGTIEEMQEIMKKINEIMFSYM